MHRYLDNEGAPPNIEDFDLTFCSQEYIDFIKRNLNYDAKQRPKTWAFLKDSYLDGAANMKQAFQEILPK
jgi:hypothetical protein